MQCAQPNTILCGRRVRLGPEITSGVTPDFIAAGKLAPFSKDVIFSVLKNDTKRASLGIRLPLWLSRGLHPKERRFNGGEILVCRKDLFMSVGGYQKTADRQLPSKERRREDAPIGNSIALSGEPKRYPLLNRAVVYHLYHPERPPNPDIDQQMQLRYDAALKQRDQLLKQSG